MESANEFIENECKSCLNKDTHLCCITKRIDGTYNCSFLRTNKKENKELLKPFYYIDD